MARTASRVGNRPHLAKRLECRDLVAGKIKPPPQHDFSHFSSRSDLRKRAVTPKMVHRNASQCDAGAVVGLISCCRACDRQVMSSCASSFAASMDWEYKSRVVVTLAWRRRGTSDVHSLRERTKTTSEISRTALRTAETFALVIQANIVFPFTSCQMIS